MLYQNRSRGRLKWLAIAIAIVLGGMTWYQCTKPALIPMEDAWSGQVNGREPTMQSSESRRVGAEMARQQHREANSGVALGDGSSEDRGNIVIRYVVSLGSTAIPGIDLRPFMRGRLLSDRGKTIAAASCELANSVEIADVPFGNYWFASVGLRPLRLKHDSESTSVDIQLGDTSVDIRVMGVEGHPLDGAIVHIYDRDGVTESASITTVGGAVRLPTLALGNCLVSGSAEGFAESNPKRPDGVTIIRLKEPAFAFRGVFVSPEGASYGGLKVRLGEALCRYDTTGSRLPGYRMTVTDAVGNFEFPNMRQKYLERLFVERAGDFAFVACVAILGKGKSIYLRESISGPQVVGEPGDPVAIVMQQETLQSPTVEATKPPQSGRDR